MSTLGIAFSYPQVNPLPLVVETRQHFFNTAQFSIPVSTNFTTSLTQVTVPVLGSAAVQVAPQANRSSQIDVINPTDGQPCYIGSSSGTNAANGALLNPGMLVRILAYNGPIYALASSAIFPATLFWFGK